MTRPFTNWATMGSLILSFLLAFVGCDSNTKIQPMDGGIGFTPGKREKKKEKDGGKLFDDGEDGGTLFGDGEDDDDDPGGDVFSDSGEDDQFEVEDPDIVFPAFEFDGRGVATCKGDTHPSTAGVTTALNEDTLDINMFRARVDVGSKGQEDADKEMQKSLGLTFYKRVTRDEMQGFKEDGFKNAGYSIFALSVDKTSKQQQFFFDKPLPVYPWPAPNSRFSPLDNGSASWTANVTGHRQFTATITISKEAETDDSVTLKYALLIHEDTNRVIYEDFPIPREAIYTINTKDRDVRQIVSTSWFNGEKCDNRPEEVRMTYKLCKKTTGDKVEDIPCN